MSSLETGTAMSRQSEVVQSAWNKLKTELEQEKVRIYAQIGHYPPPIAACDQQFNYLLDKQTKILQALARLREAENGSLTAADPLKAVDEFMGSSAYLEAMTT
ncbi:MAG TPA: hypothetical protein P5526_12610 [Anaerolineae bacterium]|nr:hypothetical protein [Anaerolineae bacterium]MCB0226319.1 hypothetical protein [Anaerolineae bacterium]HRV92996.1 hypothetical protein [Anaerolineae bacterium]